MNPSDHFTIDDSPDHSSRGEEIVRCGLGHLHWGKFGAAGIVLVVREEKTPFYLLAYRNGETHLGDCWGIPGGGIHLGEAASQAALRELKEELEGIGEVGEPKLVFVADHQGWAYSTFVAEVVQKVEVLPKSWETDEARWFSRSEVDELAVSGQLHPGFAQSWPTVSQQL